MMDKEFSYKDINKEDIYEWCSGGFFTSVEEMALSFLLNITRGDYSLEEAREDILTFKKEKK